MKLFNLKPELDIYKKLKLIIKLKKQMKFAILGLASVVGSNLTS